MCVAIPVALAIASFAASTASAVQQHQGQKAQADYQDKANDIARDQFAIEGDQQRMDGERQRAQQYAADASEVNEFQRQALRERATVDALVGEYGSGNTGDRRLATVGIQQGQDLATLLGNASKRQQELGFGQSAAIGATRAKVASLRPSERPSKLGLGLQIGASALQIGSRMNDLKPRTSGT